jgi:protein associated with RNAse G/E
MTIYDIKERTKKTAPYFFDRKTMKFFGQTMRDFKVYKQKDGKYLIVAESGSNWTEKHYTKRLFNPVTNILEMVR